MTFGESPIYCGWYFVSRFSALLARSWLHHHLQPPPEYKNHSFWCPSPFLPFFAVCLVLLCKFRNLDVKRRDLNEVRWNYCRWYSLLPPMVQVVNNGTKGPDGIDGWNGEIYDFSWSTFFDFRRAKKQAQNGMMGLARSGQTSFWTPCEKG